MVGIWFGVVELAHFQAFLKVSVIGSQGVNLSSGGLFGAFECSLEGLDIRPSSTKSKAPTK